MGRGLDGYFCRRHHASACVVPRLRGCSFQGPPAAQVSHDFPVAMARGKHLFPFRTEQLSLSAPMVLGSQGPGRVGRRRFTCTKGRLSGRPFVVVWSGLLAVAESATADVGAARPADRRDAVLRPRHPGTGSARSRAGTQRHTVRVRGSFAGAVRRGELRVLQENEGTCEGEGTPDDGDSHRCVGPALW